MGRAATECGASVALDRQVKLAEALGVGDQSEPSFLDGVVGLDQGAEHPGGHRPRVGPVRLEPVGYWQVDDIQESLQRLLDAGAQHQEVNDVGGGKLIASVQDPDGNSIGLIQSP